MTHDETVKLIGLLIVAYPNFDKYSDKAHLRSTVALWDKMFSDDDFGLVQMALEKHIATSKWPPSIAELRDIMTTITNPELIPVDEAWAIVRKLLATEERLYRPTGEYLPSIIAEAVDAVGYDQLKALSCSVIRGDTDKAGLDRVAFVQAYEGKLLRARQRAAMPEDLRIRMDAAKKHYADDGATQLNYLEKSYKEQQERLYKNSHLLPESTCESGDSK